MSTKFLESTGCAFIAFIFSEPSSSRSNPDGTNGHDSVTVWPIRSNFKAARPAPEPPTRSSEIGCQQVLAQSHGHDARHGHCTSNVTQDASGALTPDSDRWHSSSSHPESRPPASVRLPGQLTEQVSGFLAVSARAGSGSESRAVRAAYRTRVVTPRRMVTVTLPGKLAAQAAGCHIERPARAGMAAEPALAEPTSPGRSRSGVAAGPTAP